ncbi:MAG: acyl--CoA ligase [Candidatus Eisenbacteria bacterium]|nr:acyl--CoA ligase [Candidatus Eisenbacteria bacterium]
MDEPTLLHHALSRAAASDGSRPLLVAPKSQIAYGDAERMAIQCARALRRLGVRRGDRVALLWRNAPEYVAGFYGIQRAGAIAVPVNHSIDARGLLHLLLDSGAQVLIAESAFAAPLRDALNPAPGSPAPLRHLLSDRPGDWSAEGASIDPGLCLHEIAPMLAAEASDASGSEAAGTDPDGPAAIIYTSGSTGKPRGAVLSHRNLIANTRSIVSYLALSREDRMMCILPFFYVYGQSLLNTHVWVGGSLIVGSDLLFPNSVLTRMQKEEATGFAGVPSTFAILLNRSKLGQIELPRLRYLTQAGGAMAPEMTRRLIELLPDKQLFVMYGATEASARLSYLHPSDLPRKLGSIGKAIPGVDLRVLRDDATPCAPGEIGELVARGENIMSGYWNAPEETAEVLDRAGFHTGDLARVDDEGFLYIVGRKREMIKCGANRISPLEIEQVLLEHETLHEAAVVGIPDAIMGEAILAFVAVRDGVEVSSERLLSYLAARLPEYKVPKEIVLRTELPKSGAGKIDKLSLRASWLAAHSTAGSD